jgi:acetolactate synthase-1/2/3 large subunit
MVRQWQTLFFDKHYSNTVLTDRKTDFVKLSEAFGCKGEVATTVSELDRALENAFAADGTYLVDCRIDKDEFVLPMLPPGGSMDDIIVRIGD